MIKLFTVEEQPELFQIVDEVHEMLIEQCQKYNEFNETIHITTLEEMRPHILSLGQVLENGFGYSISNHPRNGDKIRIIVINTEKCIEAAITPDEFKALILHELGHLLNFREHLQVPYYMHCFRNGLEYSKQAEDDTKETNKLNDELYADYYAKQFGYGEALISSFDKHNLHFVEPFGFYDQRVESILNNEEYNGFVKPVQ